MNHLQETGLTLPQIEKSLFVIEDWLEDHYPILSKLYHAEILKEALHELETIELERRNVA